MTQSHFKCCFKCSQTKSVSEFYRHSGMSDGYLNKCKQCAKKDSINNRAENLERYQAYDRHRYETQPHRKEKLKEYSKTKQGKRLSSNAKIKWAKNNRLKVNAEQRARRAVAKGIITKKPCEVCGLTKSEAHHDDYSKPLDVMWLCDAHHKQRHKELRNLPKYESFILRK